MADLVVGLSKTVVQGALTKVQSAIEEDAKLRKKAQRDLVSITLEFEMMQSFLDVAKEESITNNMVRTWVKHVRQLAYDVEDCVEFVVHLDNTPEWWRRLLPSCVAPPLPLDVAVQELEELKRRVEDVNNCYRRYSNISDAGSSSKPLVMLQQPDSEATIIDTTAMNMIAEARTAAKRRPGLCDLPKLVMNEDGDKDLRVIAMWGTGGDLGRTASVIWKAYNEQQIHSRFTCRAWVKLMHPFNPQEFIQSLTADFYATTYLEQPGEVMASDVLLSMKADHIQEFLQQLKTKRYLIVLEDLSNMAEWRAIRTFLPNMKNGSCIIVSMQQFVVASLCIGHPYQLLELDQFSDDLSAYAIIQKGSQCDEEKCNETGDKTKAAKEWMEKYPLVGRESEMNHLRQYTYSTAIYFKILTVWGMIGAGKSALIKELFCEKILNGNTQFDKYAWVDVSHPFDLRDFSRSLLSSFHSESLHGNKESAAQHGSNCPVVECRKILSDHKCLVIIDGLKTKKERILIRTELLANKPSYENSNCIIVITNEPSMVSNGIRDSNFNVKGLEADQAFKLFEKEVSRKYGRSVPWTNDVVVELEQLVSKCGGFPKVIAEIGSSVGSILETRMNNARARHARALSNNFMNVLETDPKFHSLQGLFGWIRAYFRTCPDSLKPCIHYLSIFRQDKIIRRRRLVRRWIAEGYSRDNHEESAEENGEKQFSNLLDQSIIQQPPQKIATPSLGNTRMVLCQVNGFVHEYIVSRRMEENFVFELGKNCALTTQRTGRHLIILDDWDRDKTVFRSSDFSRLRSLTVLGKWESFFISKSMKILRVLDLEDAWGMKDSDVEMMVKLLPRLKFLSLRGCREICHLPSSLGDLRQLQTLDVRGTSIVILPENITLLQKLQYIRAGSGTKEKTSGKLNLAASAPAVSSCWLPKFSKCHQLVGVVVPGAIGKLIALHTLGVVNVGDSRWRAVLEELKKLTQLRKLGVSGINKKNGKEFFSAIEGCVHLESLSVHLNKDIGFCLDGIPMPLENLQSLKLYGLVSVKLLEWSDRLRKLTKLHLEMVTLTEDDIRFLGSLPQLCILRVKQLQDGELQFRVIVDGEEKYSFGWVKVLQIACGGSTSSLYVTFGSETMKKLELLKVDCCGGSPPYQFSGLENLEELKQVLLLNGSNAQALKDQLESQLAEHPNKPVVKLEEDLRLS